MTPRNEGLEAVITLPCMQAAQQRARADAAIEELRGSWDALAAAKQAAREAQGE
jgi:hypothetical protein